MATYTREQADDFQKQGFQITDIGQGKFGFSNADDEQRANRVSAPAKEVAMLDVGNGIEQVNNQYGYLNKTYPVTNNATPAGQVDNFGVPIENSVENKNQPIGVATYTNANGQEFSYNQSQLDDPTIQNQIASEGLTLMKADAGLNLSGTKKAGEYNQAVNEVANLTKDFLSYNVDTDPSFQAVAQNIKNKFARLSAEMEKSNEQRQRGFETLGLRGGTTQYGGQVQMGLEGEELKQGGQRLADIASEEAQTISAARSAYETGKYTQFNAKVNALKDIRDEKAKALESYNKSISDAITKQRDQQKFDFEVYKFQQEQKAKAGEGTKPMVVAPGSSIYDPSTGDFVGTAPERPSDNKPITEKIGNNLVQWNPKLNIWEKIYSGDSDTSGVAIDWANGIRNGIYKPTDVPDELKSEVAKIMGALPPDENKIAPVREKIDQIDSLLTSSGMKGTVGSYGISRFTPFSPDAGARQDFIAGVQQLISQDTLQTLIDLKAQGGTLGALSDGERITLQNAASKISSWALPDKDTGKIIGYEISEDLFKKELNRIKDLAEKAIVRAGGRTVESASKAVDDYYVQHPEKREYIDTLESTNNPFTNKPYTDEEKAEVLGIGFNQVGGDTKLATKAGSIEDFSKGGQCGRFVNNLTGLGLADSYESKMAKMDKTITEPQAGMVFVMPYKDTGHTGIILSVNNGIATVKDSNYGLDEKVRTHQIPIYKMTGFKRVNV